MASLVLGRHHEERRRERRCDGGRARWSATGILRPGQPITVINICTRAALLESPDRLRPGAHTEMQLAHAGKRESMKGRLDRCYVSGLEPLRYRGVLIFDACVDLGSDGGESNE